MTKPSPKSNNSEHHDMFTRAIPDPSLYEYYADRKGRIRNTELPIWRRNSTLNPDYVLISLRRTQGFVECHYLDEHNESWGDEQEQELAQKLVDAYDRIYEADIDSGSDWNEIYPHLRSMHALFNVDKSIFNPRHDRQCEIREGYLYDAYMVSALRSFAWTLADYCERKGMTPSDVSYPEVRRLVDFIAAHDWLNYDNVSYCKGLCDAPDSDVFYAPDGLSESDLSLIPGFQSCIEFEAFEVKDLLTTAPIIRSLNALESDLAFIFPAILLLFDELAINRNYLEHLTGDDADIVYAWLVFVYASSGPFSLEKSDPWYDDIIFEREKDDRDRWFDRHGDKLTENPAIEFRNKRFFFCDLDEPFDAREHPTVWNVVGRGGIRQGSVTSLTDYLVVNAPPPHRYYGSTETDPPRSTSDSWINLADDYRRRGRHIDIVFQKDVEAALELAAPALVDHALHDASPKTAKRSTQMSGQSQVGPYAQKTKLAPAGDLVIDDQGTLVKYKGSEEHIILPEGITAIGKEAFWDHRSLVSIVLPEGVQKIGNAAFYALKKLRHITLPSTLRTIGKEAFTDCIGLTEMVFPEGLEQIGQEAFSGCENLESIAFPSTLRAISKWSFRDCYALRYVDVPEGVERIDNYAFLDCFSVSKIRLPSTLRKIGFCAFYRCSALEGVVIPEGVEVISAAAFSNCERLKSVTFSGEAAPDVPFTFGTDLSPVRLQGRLRRIEKEAFAFCHALVEIDIPEGIETIEPMTFEGCVNLKQVTLPSTLKVIGAYAFFGCQKLETIVIPDGLEEIGDNAFGRCMKLKDVDLPGIG
jgi:hypothetical protein